MGWQNRKPIGDSDVDGRNSHVGRDRMSNFFFGGGDWGWSAPSSFMPFADLLKK